MSWGTHLREFYGRLVYRRVVPKDVRPHIGKTEWTKVLGATSLCRSERSRLEKFEDVRFEQAVAAARQRARQAVMEAPNAVPALPVVEPVQKVPEAVVQVVPVAAIVEPDPKPDVRERAIPEPPMEALVIEVVH